MCREELPQGPIKTLAHILGIPSYPPPELSDEDDTAEDPNNDYIEDGLEIFDDVIDEMWEETDCFTSRGIVPPSHHIRELEDLGLLNPLYKAREITYYSNAAIDARLEEHLHDIRDREDAANVIAEIEEPEVDDEDEKQATHLNHLHLPSMNLSPVLLQYQELARSAESNFPSQRSGWGPSHPVSVSQERTPLPHSIQYLPQVPPGSFDSAFNIGPNPPTQSVAFPPSAAVPFEYRPEPTPLLGSRHHIDQRQPPMMHSQLWSGPVHNQYPLGFPPPGGWPIAHTYQASSQQIQIAYQQSRLAYLSTRLRYQAAHGGLPEDDTWRHFYDHQGSYTNGHDFPPNQMPGGNTMQVYEEREPSSHGLNNGYREMAGIYNYDDNFYQ